MVTAAASTDDLFQDMLRTLGVFQAEVTADGAHPALWRLRQNIAQREYQGPAMCAWLRRERQQQQEEEERAAAGSSRPGASIDHPTCAHSVCM